MHRFGVSIAALPNRPRAAEGGNEEGNLALACESCNLFKSDATTAFDEVESREIVLFHPRRDNWSEHFHFDAETVELRGQTATGRATVRRLHMNSDFQLRARRHWIQLGLYP